MEIPVTAYFVAFLALIQVPMTIAVGLRRAQTDIHFYDDGDISLRRNMRAHANFTETVPITLIAMGMAEFVGVSSALLWAGGASLIAGRAMNYWILRARGWGPPRALSMVLTFLAMGGFACAIMLQLVRTI